ncbi:Hsp33 family molecular chaperone HslO [Gehongia tenuis]|uniref:33 kDa chaperonin n=1 Tax=Gehongia tenuis TaxID=2763655 RepID=A0A926D350_9FIRM|nr:Hsp33 family molecular chaperone HslO [Gehongia tenuis]MBC8531520.1 Hsp33 family molecular chaperone HslO [Gehongia tenuis]
MDKIISASLAGGDAVVMLAHGPELCERARQIHGLSPVATAALGRTLIMSVMMARSLKNESGSLSATIKGNGPLGGLVTVAYPDGTAKGYVNNPDVELPLNGRGKLDVGGAIGEGTLTVIKDIGMKKPYVGKVELKSGEIAEDFAWYLALSEQKPGIVSLGVRVDTDGSVLDAGGVWVQPLPGCKETTLDSLEAIAPLLSNVSNLFEGHTVEEVLDNEFGFLDAQVLETFVPAFRCDCSRERIEQVLISMGEAEIRDILEKQGEAEVTCHFCREAYKFSGPELEALLASAKS